MPAIELNIKNFPAQREIFESPARYKIVVKGRRFGLTRGAANDFMQSALNRSFKQGFWGDTINSNIDRYVQRYFIPELKKLPKNMWNWKQQQKTLIILDSYIDFRSADNPENWEGFGYDKVFLNEAGIILRNEYLWNNAIQPMLMEYKPQIVIGGTPKGKGLLYDLARKGQDKDNGEYKFFHYTTYQNPYLDKDEVDRMVADMPEHVARQEIYGEFMDDSGSVFRGTRDIMTATPEKPLPGHIYVMGVDLARVQDYTVITVYDRSTLSQVYQDRFKEINWNLQKRRITAIAKLYNNALAIVDASGLGDPIAEDLILGGVSVKPFKFTNESKAEIVDKLSIWIEQRKFRMLPIEETLHEFNEFTYEVSSTGKIRYNAHEGAHDDIVMAHALALTELYYVERAKEPKKTTIQLALERRIASQSREETYSDIEFE